jgi:hypothetical protein
MSEPIVPNANDAKLRRPPNFDAAQLAGIGGGGAENCAVTVQISGDGITGTFSAGSVGEALIAATKAWSTGLPTSSAACSARRRSLSPRGGP